jgi:hypothetical protein
MEGRWWCVCVCASVCVFECVCPLRRAACVCGLRSQTRPARRSLLFFCIRRRAPTIARQPSIITIITITITPHTKQPKTVVCVARRVCQRLCHHRHLCRLRLPRVKRGSEREMRGRARLCFFIRGGDDDDMRTSSKQQQQQGHISEYTAHINVRACVCEERGLGEQTHTKKESLVTRAVGFLPSLSHSKTPPLPPLRERTPTTLRAATTHTPCPSTFNATYPPRFIFKRFARRDLCFVDTPWRGGSLSANCCQACAL